MNELLCLPITDLSSRARQDPLSFHPVRRSVDVVARRRRHRVRRHPLAVQARFDRIEEEGGPEQVNCAVEDPRREHSLAANRTLTYRTIADPQPRPPALVD